MIQELYDEYIIIYVFAGLCGLGVLLRLLLNLIYKHLVKESENIGATKNKSLKHIKLKFETCYKLKIGVNNVDTFVDKNVYKYRFCGILLSTWENLGGQVIALSLLLIPITTVFGYIFECGQEQVILTGSVGLLAAAILLFVDKSVNLTSKKDFLRVNLLDYLDNFCKVRLEQETFQPEVLEQYRRAFFEPEEAEKQISATAFMKKDPHREELERRKEARRKKDEEKQALVLKKQEELRRLEEARLEEERRKAEERKQLAAKRREEERIRMEEEQEALEARRLEAKKKADEKREFNEKKNQQMEKEIILHNLEEELRTVENDNDMDLLLQGIAEIAADKDRIQRNAGNRSKNKVSEEDKVLEDILKEFFA